MSTTTTNLALVKPATSDLIAISVINGHMDTLDSVVAGKAAASTTVTGHALTSNVTVTAGDLGVVPTGTTVNGHALSSNVTVSATDVGLGNCDNTSDANKPVSTATQNALNAKTNTLGIVQTRGTFTATGYITIGGTGGITRYNRVVEGGVISKIRIYVSVSSGNVAVAVYANSGTGISSVPGGRLGTSGSVACPATGFADVSLGGNVTVSPGDWLALSADGNTATFWGTSGAGDSTFSTGLQGSNATFPPADPAGTMTPGNNRMHALVGIA